MPSTVTDVVFSEPSGTRIAFVMFAAALVTLSSYVYYDVLLDSTAVHSFVMAIGFALSGFAESLPQDRRRLAGGLRVSALLVFLGLLGVTITAPTVYLLQGENPAVYGGGESDNYSTTHQRRSGRIFHANPNY
jgi:hypothetical protein